MNTHDIWQSVLAEFELSPDISKANYNTWIKNTAIMEYNDNEVIICVPSTFVQAWLEKKYHTKIVNILERVTGKPIKKLTYKVGNLKNILPQDSQNTPILDSIEIKPQPPIKQFSVPCAGGVDKFGLNSKYVFGRYVVGSGSELAFAASQAVVNKPGEAYNPLFIYGGVGLGKTHLLQAIGNELLKKNPSLRIMYASAERFSNDFILSVKEGNAKTFQSQYRNVDLLLIDDIQFISGKDRTQESFFHTFNELHQQNKQVVMTSDRPPKAIPALEDRLKSRFEWGMIVDISPPDLETRIAVLQKKCAEMNFPLNPDIFPTIATTVHKNIRELEGALNKIIAFHQLKNIAPTTESVKSLLSSMEVHTRQKSTTPQGILDAICQFYEVPLQDILGSSREKRFSMPRQIVMHLMRKELNMSFPAIGNEMGGRDHTTAMHADHKIQNQIDNDPKLRQEVELIKQKLYVNNI
ncbi:MAG: chromosomal replication initiator protein DnaA [Candidatus Magasanikbacteria bacterium CG10_big_fil_rev_8_21_14_0_10_40_10]|uniref:Chromosomal replication initiator protein DnaA n=1 Tax=Candidatus Magasanikbacteria bacterium CG10_big_fil_rev_8_21_14_0_10_40_10 TaxID=1974648 RepID=A0A2M6W3C6_9BACT|nr:MAG: chromosomal replication initiator protein DnaA [Candidatus Magasanikbacteria bacterium CG10_big_fil_rev_8_21_14_0_10_40_10]